MYYPRSNKRRFALANIDSVSPYTLVHELPRPPKGWQKRMVGTAMSPNSQITPGEILAGNFSGFALVKIDSVSPYTQD